MKRNMKQWIKEYIEHPVKKAMPILSFPGVQLINSTVSEMVQKAELQAECMKAVAEKFDTGAVFSLMDLSVEAEAFGSPVQYNEDEVPTVLEALVHNEEEAQTLKIPCIGAGRTGECVKGIRLACEQITDGPVFAGMIGPYSLAGRLLDMTEIMIMCYEEPETVEIVLEKATQFLIEYARAFKEAGANGIAMAEPAAGLLSPGLLEEFSNPYVKRIKEAVEDDNFIVLYHNCGFVVPLMQHMKELNMTAYSFGNAIDMEEALKVLPEDAMLLGNIDPVGILRNGTVEQVRIETKALLKRCGRYPNFVISSGCDIPPQTPLENLEALFETVKEFYEE